MARESSGPADATTEPEDRDRHVAIELNRKAFLLALSDRLRPLTDPDEIQQVAVKALGEHLGANRVGYAEDQEDGTTLAVTSNFTNGAASLVGRYRYEDFGPDIEAELRAGRSTTRSDIANDPSLTAPEKQARAMFQIGASASVPLTKAGRLFAVMFVHFPEAHAWTEEELSLLEEVAERTCTAIDRARVEAALAESEARLRQAVEVARVGTYVWHAHEDRIQPDARMLSLFGLPPDGTLDLKTVLTELIHVDDRERYGEAVRAALDPNGFGQLHEDVRVVHRNGSVHWLAITGQTTFGDYPRRALRMVGMAIDVTERKTVEDALRRGEQQLKDSDRKKDEFIATLAHELRNPLEPVRMGLELIRLGGDSREAVARVRHSMERQIGHMVHLIDDLLDVSRITSGKIRLQHAVSPLLGLIQGAVEANRTAIRNAEIQLTLNIPHDPIWLNVDPTRFVQVLSNLINNAVKFSHHGGHVAISARLLDADPQGAQMLELTVTDDGIGISPEMLPRVFDLFAQEESSAERSPAGLGIGLSLARRLIELQQGTIEAHSDGPGRGATFMIRIPVVPSASEESRPERPPRQLSLTSRVLVIDDNADAAQATAMLVEALGGRSAVAYDGHTGLEKAVEFRPDVILLDIGMPGMDGYECCRKIRAALGSHVRIAAVTGWGQGEDKDKARRAGFDAHLTKPTDPTALEELLVEA